MIRDKKRLRYPLIVEGRYDKCSLSSLFSGLIVSLDGFSVFNSREKQALIRRVADRGVILLTDSDGGGRQLRSFISSILPKEKVYNVYIPRIEGKEKRKRRPSKEGYLGVEGMEPDVLIKILAPFTEDGDGGEREAIAEITTARFFSDGFTGAENSTKKRAALAVYLGLPEDMTAKALLNAVNIMGLCEEYEKFNSISYDT